MVIDITFIPCNNTNIVNNNNHLPHSTSFMPNGISSTQLSANAFYEHAQIMPIVSPVHSNLPCHLNTLSITSCDINFS